MKVNLHKLLPIFFMLCLLNAYAARTPHGTWRCHSDYSNVISIDEYKEFLFFGGKTGMFFLDKNYNAIVPTSKAGGFSDIAIKTLKFNPYNLLLYIAYLDGGIDVWRVSKEIKNIPELKRYSNVIGIKEINGFAFTKDFVFVATTFGIVKIDSKTNVVLEDYQNIYPTDASICTVNSLVVFKDSLYAATNRGVICASLSSGINLRDYTNWKLRGDSNNCKAVDTFQGKLFIGRYSPKNAIKYDDNGIWKYIMDTNAHYIKQLSSKNGKLLVNSETVNNFRGSVTLIEPDLTFRNLYLNDNSVIYDNEGNIWRGSTEFGVIRNNSKTGKDDYIKPNGPLTTYNYDLLNVDSITYVAYGGARSDYSPYYWNYGFGYYNGAEWITKNIGNVPEWENKFGKFHDIFAMIYQKSTKKIFMGSMVDGLLEWKDNNVNQVYNNKNSPITTYVNGVPGEPQKISGFSIDQFDNLWMANLQAPRPLIVKTLKNKFISFDIGTSNLKKDICKVAADDYNQVWCTTPISGGITVFNYGKTIEDLSDDNFKELGTDKGNGNLPDNRCNGIIKDLNGQIWIVTNAGVCYYSDPSSVFNKQSVDATKPWVEDGDNSGPLLYGQIVNCVAIDGANRKWFGTKNGAYLTSEDGTKILQHFTADNSSLLKNEVKIISVNGVTGEVFFGTDYGISSYRDVATEGAEEFSKVYAYPNPVRPNYSGSIYITGLIKDCNVKITDLMGKLVYETLSIGGTAEWNGRDFQGRRANSGVYLVFLGNNEASKTEVTKIMFVR